MYFLLKFKIINKINLSYKLFKIQDFQLVDLLVLVVSLNITLIITNRILTKYKKYYKNLIFHINIIGFYYFRDKYKKLQ